MTYAKVEDIPLEFSFPVTYPLFGELTFSYKNYIE